jgi:uncharacterized membrane protein YbhN (UPF0104 family)
MAVITGATWVAEACVWGAVAAAVDLAVSPVELLYLLSLAAMVALIPSGPGYAGTTDAAVIVGVKTVGGTSSQAFSYLILLRFILLVPITAAGLTVLAVNYRGTRLLRAGAR